MPNKAELDKLPTVSFEYPDSENALLRNRLVKVVSMNTKYVKGYELQQGPAWKFKQYKVRRIAQNGVALLAFGS